MKKLRGNHELELTPLNRVTAASEATDTEASPGTGIAGIFKLKQHVDNPGQTPM
jgi:hypothetical protein